MSETAGSEIERTEILQHRIDLLLTGRVHVPVRPDADPDRDQTPFAFFMAEDLRAATNLASHFISTAKRAQGDRLEAAINAIYESLGYYKPGLVEYAAKLFLTHYPEARERLVIRSVEELQPGLVQPSRRDALVKQ